MADDAEHRGNTACGEGSGRETEEEGIMYTKLKNGSLKLYELEKDLPPLDAIRVRRGFIEQETGTSLENIGIFSIDIERVVKRNCENMIGTVQVPVGVAGPILFRGNMHRGIIWLPLATTEGALVASVNRGCSAITKAGGAEVRILHDGMTRAPVFAADSVVHAKQVATGWRRTMTNSAPQQRVQPRMGNSPILSRLLPAPVSLSGWSSTPRMRWA